VNEKKLRKLLQIFADSNLEDLEIQHSFWRGTKVKLSRRNSQTSMSQDLAPPPTSHETPAMPAAASPPLPAAEEMPSKATDEDARADLHAIKAPMVGTFFRAASPEESPFINAGDQVEPGQTIGIIEAMKIMNEIEADIKGEVVEILVDNAEPVEYNQLLLYIRPS